MFNLKMSFMFLVASLLFCFESTLQYSFYQSTSAAPSNNTGCVVTNYQTSEHWQLVYEDNFRHSSSLDDWTIWHETKICASNNGRYRSCKSRDNIRIIDGHLVLQLSRSPHYAHHYSGAQMSHKNMFQYGRYEIRVAHPIGEALLSSVMVYGDHTYGSVELSKTVQDSSIIRGVSLSNGTFIPRNHYLTFNKTSDGFYHDPANFNVYGLEWNHTVVRFFVNELYTDPVDIGDIDYEMGNYHRLMLTTAVLAQESQGQTDLLWTCPAMIFDYIRIFQRIDTQATTTHSKCTFRPLTPDSMIDGICSQVMDSMDKANSSKPILTTGQGILIIWLVILSCLNILGLALLFKLNLKVEGSNPNGSWMQWRWTNARPDQLNDGFVRSTDNVS